MAIAGAQIRGSETPTSTVRSNFPRNWQSRPYSLTGPVLHSISAEFKGAVRSSYRYTLEIDGRTIPIAVPGWAKGETPWAGLSTVDVQEIARAMSAVPVPLLKYLQRVVIN